MKYLRGFHESKLIENLPPMITISQCQKNKESWNFISKFLNTITFEDYMNNQNLHQVCAHDDSGNLVGLRIFRLYNDKIHLNWSAVDSSYRNMGINQKMFDEILDIAKNKNIKLITSNVRQSNTSSLKSLLTSGFKINNKREDMFYPDGEKKIPLYYNL